MTSEFSEDIEGFMRRELAIIRDNDRIIRTQWIVREDHLRSWDEVAEEGTELRWHWNSVASLVMVRNTIE